MIGRPLELRPGTAVRYVAAASNEWQDGTLVRASPNGEEWLVKNRFGKFWLQIGRLRPASEPQEP